MIHKLIFLFYYIKKDIFKLPLRFRHLWNNTIISWNSFVQSKHFDHWIRNKHLFHHNYMHLDHVHQKIQRNKKREKISKSSYNNNLHIPNIYAVKQILRSLLKWFGEVSKLQIFEARYIAITYLCSLIKINQSGLNKGCWRHIISIRRKTNEIPSFYKNKWHDESCFTFWILIGLCVCLSVQMKYFHIFFFQFAHYGGLYRRVDGL